MARPRIWQEPAHSVVVKRFDDLVAVFTSVRESYQEVIDKAFDDIAQHIGFIVTTTLPVSLELGKDGRVGDIKLDVEKLEKTIFAQEFAPVFERIKKGGFGKTKAAAGSYQLIFIWHDALKLKLKHDWMEPAHFQPVGAELLRERLAVKVRPEVQEPAHWFDGGITLETEEELLISVIDEVYPELKLVDRVAMGRYETRKLVPGVREPAHFRHIFEDLYAERFDRRLVPGVREPAHFRRFSELLTDPDKVELLTELSVLLRKLGI